MLIPIIALIVLVGLGAYLFFTRPTAQEVQSPVSDVASEETPSTSPVDTLAEAKAAKVEVDAVIAKADKAIAKADEVLNTPVVETAPVVEVAPAEVKPKRKKRYYKPKAKK